MASKSSRSAPVKTPLVRFCYTQDLFTPKADKNGKLQYRCTLLIPKTADISVLRNAVLEVAVAQWGDKARQMLKDELIKSPFLDGDGKQALNKKTGERHKGHEGHVFIRCISGGDFKPKVVDRRLNPVVDKSDFPSGYYGYAVVSAFTWENEENGKGVSFSISLAQIAKEGEVLGGGGSADPEAYFEKIDDEGPVPTAAKSGEGAGNFFN